jgi:hypothetical protein
MKITKKPDQKTMNTLFFLLELYLLVMSIITIDYGFIKIAMFLLSFTVLTLIIHCILYRNSCGIVIEKDECCGL